MKDAYSFDRDDDGLDASYAKFVERLRPHLRPRRPGVVPGGIRRRADGRLRARRVHGAVPGGRERRRPGARATRPTPRSRAPSPQAVAGARPRGGELHTPGADHDRRRGRRARHASPATCSRPMPVVTESRGLVMAFVRGDHRVNEIKLANALGEGFRPAQRRRAARAPAGFLGADARSATLWDEAIVPGQAYVTRRQPPPITTAWVNQSTGARRGDVRTGRGRATPSTATRSGSSPRSRSATSSSSAHATPSRSAPRTSTRTARSSTSGWAPTASARRGSPRPRSSSTPTRRASPGRARSRRGRSSSSARQARHARARGRGGALRRAARRRPGGPARRPRRGPGREVRRRRAARRVRCG